eukprot:COSAG01_NODE_1641_length_9647_cov_5.299539_13_plen_142_part_00
MFLFCTQEPEPSALQEARDRQRRERRRTVTTMPSGRLLRLPPYKQTMSHLEKDRAALRANAGDVARAQQWRRVPEGVELGFMIQVSRRGSSRGPSWGSSLHLTRGHAPSPRDESWDGAGTEIDDIPRLTIYQHCLSLSELS